MSHRVTPAPQEEGEAEAEEVRPELSAHRVHSPAAVVAMADLHQAVVAMADLHQAVVAEAPSEGVVEAEASEAPLTGRQGEARSLPPARTCACRTAPGTRRHPRF